MGRVDLAPSHAATPNSLLMGTVKLSRILGLWRRYWSSV